MPHGRGFFQVDWYDSGRFLRNMRNYEEFKGEKDERKESGVGGAL